jgi:LPXTG-motif cell wall-anchored protein
VQSFINWISGIALTLGGPGLFVIAFLDSSFVSLPQINDVLVVLMVTKYKQWMPYYAAMATLGSVAGCFVIYRLAEKGGEVFLGRRLKGASLQRILGLYRRHGLLALMVPALLPPPAPFKIFVLLAGVAQVPIWQFIAAVFTARFIRYFGEGLLAVWYGDKAGAFIKENSVEAGLILAGLALAGGVVWVLWRRRKAAA